MADIFGGSATQLYWLQNTKQGKADVLKGKIERR